MKMNMMMGQNVAGSNVAGINVAGQGFMPGAVAINGGVGVMELRRLQVNMDLLPSVDDVMNSVAAVAAEIAENAHITLRELKTKIDAVTEKKLPQYKQLMEQNPVAVAQTRVDGATLTAYQNGYDVYEMDGARSVMAVDRCGDYRYDFNDGTYQVVTAEVFEEAEWSLRLIMEGERRLEHNLNKTSSKYEAAVLECDGSDWSDSIMVDFLEEDNAEMLADQELRRLYAAMGKHSLEHGSIDDVPVDITNGISTVGLGTQWFCGDEINSDSEAAIYEELANDIRDRIADLKRERDALELEQGATAIARKNFDFFVRCLKALPETNFAGMQMNVNGLDVQGSMFRDMEGKAIAGKRSSARSGHIRITEEKLAAAPDYLNFEKGIYTAFIKSGVVKGDTVEYQTNFGEMLTTTGNSRNLSSFLGFRRANPDGTVMFLDEKWKVSGRSVCYTRKKLKEKDRLKDKRRVQSTVMTADKRKKGEEMLRWIEQRTMGN